MNYCLTRLSLSGNRLSDLSPMTSMTRLNEISMRNNRISDLLPLASLINITLLNLDNNQISDISSLAPLADLSRLTLYGNQISDIEPLVVNTGLAEGDVVDLRGNPLSTTSVSVYITQLEKRGVIIYQ